MTDRLLWRQGGDRHYNCLFNRSPEQKRDAYFEESLNLLGSPVHGHGEENESKLRAAGPVADCMQNLGK